MSKQSTSHLFMIEPESFYSNDEAEFQYIRLNKRSFIQTMKLTEEELLQEYNIKSKSGSYKQDDLYEINHLVFPIKGNKSESIL